MPRDNDKDNDSRGRRDRPSGGKGRAGGSKGRSGAARGPEKKFAKRGFAEKSDGDKGERRPNGLLKLTGRVKELFKTSKGKYVSPAPIENHLNAHPLVEMALVSGVGQPAAYAMVVLAEDVRPKVGNAAVRAQVEQDLAQLLKTVNSGLADYEKLQMIVVAPEPWSIENGCLTPTMKIKRSRIEASVEPQVEAWYAKKGAVLWV